MAKVEMINGVVSFVGIGSNLSGTVERCREAILHMAAADGIDVLRNSSWYRSEPVGFREQDWFINAVAEVRTTMTARMLMKTLQSIEADMGRVKGEKWGPRIIDLDILLYGQDVIRDDDLIVPHPELHARRFVLVPFCELASHVIHPSLGISMGDLLLRLEDGSKVEMI